MSALQKKEIELLENSGREPVLQSLRIQLLLQLLEPRCERMVVHLKLSHTGAHSLTPRVSQTSDQVTQAIYYSSAPCPHLLHLLDGACSTSSLASKLALQVLDLLVVHRAEASLVLSHLLLIRVPKLLEEWQESATIQI